MKKPCDRLKWARLHKGYTTAKHFADTHDVPQSTYANHEMGKRELRLKVAERYALFLDIDPIWLLTGDARYQPSFLGKNVDENEKHAIRKNIADLNFLDTDIDPSAFFDEVYTSIETLFSQEKVTIPARELAKIAYENCNEIISTSETVEQARGALNFLVSQIQETWTKTPKKIINAALNFSYSLETKEKRPALANKEKPIRKKKAQK